MKSRSPTMPVEAMVASSGRPAAVTAKLLVGPVAERHRPARILALMTDCYGARGGIAQYNRDLVGAFAGSSHVEAVLIMPRLGGATEITPLPGVRQRPAVAGRARYCAEAIAASRCFGPFDVVFCGHLYLAPAAAVLARLLGRPFWLQVHGVDAWERPSSLLRRSVAAADLVTAVSRYTRRRILQWADIHPEQIKVLPNTFRFPIRPRPADWTPGSPHVAGGKPFILTVARINTEDAYKGHRRVIAVLSALRARHPDLHYVVAGDGTDRASLERAAADAGLAHAVVFLGHVPDETLADVFSAASAFVMPSTKEGFGIVFQEAAALGVPVIAGNLDGSVDALGDGAIGQLVDPEDPDALTKAIDAALSGTAPAIDTDALAAFTAPRFAAHVDAILAQLLSQPRRGRRN